MSGYLPAFLLLSCLATVASFRLPWGRINPVSVYFTVWSSVLLLYSLGFLGVEPLANRTWLLVGFAGVSFTVGAFYVWLLVVGRHGGLPEPRSSSPVRYNQRKLLTAYRVGLTSLTLYVVLQLIAALPTLEKAGGVGAIVGGDGLQIRRALQDAAHQDAITGFNSGTAVLAVAGYVLFLGSMTLFWAPHLIRSGHTLLGLAPLGLMATASLVTLERFSFLYSLVLFAFGWMYHRNGSFLSRRSNATRMPVVALLIVAVPLMVYLPLKARQPTLTPAGAIRSVGTYYVGGVAALNTEARASLQRPRERNGVWTFWGLASVLQRFGAPIDLPPNRLPFRQISNYGRDPTNPYSRGAESNVYTYLIYPLYDFGYLGVIILPFLLGLLASALHYCVTVRRRFDLMPASALLLTSVVMSFFALSLIRDFRYVFLALASGFVMGLVTDRNRVPAAYAKLEHAQ